MGGQTLASDGGLSDITNLLSLVKDQKTSTSTSTNISKEGVTQQINDILQGTSGLAAVAGAQKTAGLYNSSTNTQLTNDLLARASAQVAAKNATQTTTQTKKASVTKGNVESLLATTALKKAIGSDTLKNGAKSVYGSIADELGIATGANDTATANALSSVSGAGPGSQVGDFTSLESSLAGGANINAGSASALADSLTSAGTTAATSDTSVAGLEALDSAAAAGTGATAAQVASFDAGTSAGASGAAADFFGADAGLGTASAASSGADVAGLAALDSEAAAGSSLGGLSAAGATGWGALAVAGAADLKDTLDSGDSNALTASIIGGLGTGDIIRGLDSGNIADSVNPLGRGLLEDIGLPAKGGWIVCTELLRQGKFNKRHYIIGLRVFQSYPQHLTCGYYLWAIPLVAHIRRNPSSRITSAAKHIFAARAEYLAARAGIYGARDTVYNHSISTLMYSVCWILGQALHARSVLKSSKKEANHGWN